MKGKVTVMLVVTVTVSVTVTITVTVVVIVTIWRKDAAPVCTGRMCTKWRSLYLGEGRTYHSMTSGEGLSESRISLPSCFQGSWSRKGQATHEIRGGSGENMAVF